MEKDLYKREYEELKSLFAKKQFQLCEKKAITLLGNIKVTDENSYIIFRETTILLNHLLISSAKIPGAENLMKNAVNRYPFEEKFLVRLAEIYHRLKRDDNLREVLEKLVDIDPTDFKHRIRLITHLIKINKNIQAIIHIKYLLSLDCVEINLLKLLISLSGKEEIFSEQLKYINLGQNLFPEDDLLVIEEARALFRLKQYFQAFEVIEDFIDSKIEMKNIDPGLADILLEFSELYFITGFRDLLVKNFFRLLVLERQKQDKELKLKLANLATEINMEILFKYFSNSDFSIGKAREVIVSKNTQISELDYITNCILIIRETLKNKKISLNDFFAENTVLKALPKEIALALFSVIDTIMEAGSFYV